jgi:cohesin complex subunit SA-1/2
MQALAEWITIYPDVYFESQYMRYIGWVLSDAHAHARLEAVKALLRQYKDQDKLSGLRTFTERFRPRLVEMAERDSEPSVRAAAIELLDVLREAGFLEPTELDSIGKLVFDTEPRVRKAVVNFFAELVNEAYEARIEELGGQESVEEVVGALDPDDEDYDSPRLEWLKIKCLVEQLHSFDAADEVEANEFVNVPGTDAYMLVPGQESRFSLAAEVLCERIPELKWEILAGYLLYDHSKTPAQNGKANGANADTSLLFKQDVKLAQNDEILLLEILNAGVKSSLTHLSSAGHDRTKKATAAQKRAEQEEIDAGSRQLASLIPKLLNKFGAIPDAASAVLRLQHGLNPDSQDSTAYSALLDDVKKQFLAHAKPSVLEEASLAFLNARTGDTDELAQAKVTSLAEDATEKLNILAKGRNLSTRGNLNDTMLAVLEGTVLRLEMLGRIEDICELLETKAPAPKRKNAPPQASPVDTLLTILDRGSMSDEELDSTVSAKENSVTLHTARALGFYFLWKVLSLRKQIASTAKIPSSTLETLATRKDKFTDSVTKIIRTKSGADETRLILCGALIDLHVAFASLLHIKPAKRPARPVSGDDAEAGASDDSAYEQLASELPKSTQTLLTHVLSAAEKAFAKRSKRTLLDADEDEVQDEPQTDDEPESEPEEDEEQEEENENDPSEPLSIAAEARLAASLVAEQRLCEFASKLVLGIWSGVIDGKHEGSEPGVAKRVKRNRARLGANFKAVVDALEKGGSGKSGKAKPANAAAQPQKKSGSAAGKTMKSAELIESDEEDEDENQQEEDLQMEDEDAARERESTVDGAAEEVESVLGD